MRLSLIVGALIPTASAISYIKSWVSSSERSLFGFLSASLTIIRETPAIVWGFLPSQIARVPKLFAVCLAACKISGDQLSLLQVLSTISAGLIRVSMSLKIVQFYICQNLHIFNSSKIVSYCRWLGSTPDISCCVSWLLESIWWTNWVFHNTPFPGSAII